MEPLYDTQDPLFTSKSEQRTVFFLVFVGLLALTYGFFFLIDFLPEKPEVGAEEVVEEEIVTLEEGLLSAGGVVEATTNIDPYPVRIIFDTLDERSLSVQNPESRSVEALDTALLSGVVRHPDSADFERTGTIFLFGHSSYLPNVINKNFQAFNGVQNLRWGDTVRLQSNDREYVYRVDRVYEVSANDAEVKIESGTAKLTLVTCDSFGAKSDRFIVEATLVSNTALGEVEEGGS